MWQCRQNEMCEVQLLSLCHQDQQLFYCLSHKVNSCYREKRNLYNQKPEDERYSIIAVVNNANISPNLVICFYSVDEVSTVLFSLMYFFSIFGVRRVYRCPFGHNLKNGIAVKKSDIFRFGFN